jgi:hypothetical protein
MRVVGESQPLSSDSGNGMESSDSLVIVLLRNGDF